MKTNICPFKNIWKLNTKILKILNSGTICMVKPFWNHLQNFNTLYASLIKGVIIKSKLLSIIHSLKTIQIQFKWTFSFSFKYVLLIMIMIIIGFFADTRDQNIVRDMLWYSFIITIMALIDYKKKCIVIS